MKHRGVFRLSVHEPLEVGFHDQPLSGARVAARRLRADPRNGGLLQVISRQTHLVSAVFDGRPSPESPARLNLGSPSFQKVARRACHASGVRPATG